MKNKKPNAALIWKHLDDFVVPNLALNVFDRAVYSYLLRHSHLEGSRRLHFSCLGSAKGVRISEGGARACRPPSPGSRRAAPDRAHQNRSPRRGLASGGDSRRVS